LKERTRRGAKWDLSRSSFDSLLRALAPDREEAAAQYESLRQRLVYFFELRWPSSAEDLADEAFNRLAKRLSEGEVIHQIPPYLMGIARLLAREKGKEGQPNQIPALEMIASHEPRKPDAIQRHFQACFDELAFRDRKLVEVYYGGEGAERKRNREALAAELGVSLNALRNRVFRLRATLERCVRSRSAREARDV